MVLVASLVLLTIAVVEPPSESHDLWSYAMSGRILEHYGDSPYTHAPAAYPHDPLLAQVASGWRHTRSVYGPAFTAISAGITSVTGTDLLATRLGFQLLAALCVLALLLILYRTTRDPVVVALVGCNPVVMIEVVNIGRNDALVGLAVLVGVLLASRRRFVAAAVVLALGALVKIVVIAALGVVVLWVWRRYGARIAAGAAAAGAFVVAIPYTLAGGTRALKPVEDASDRMSRASVWQLTRHEGFEHLLGLREAQRVGAVVGSVGPEALLAVVALGVLFACSRLTDPTPELVALGVLTAFLFAGSYVLASYAMWVIPIAAWRRPRRGQPGGAGVVGAVDDRLPGGEAHAHCARRSRGVAGVDAHAASSRWWRSEASRSPPSAGCARRPPVPTHPCRCRSGRRREPSRGTARRRCPRERKEGEHRVAITPDGVHELMVHGVPVVVETRRRRGLVDHRRRLPRRRRRDRRRTADDVWARADLVLKVKEPQPEELDRLRPGLVLFTYLHLAAYPQVADALLERGVTGVAYETVQSDVGRAAAARADERGRGAHGAAGRLALPRARARRPGRAARRRARRPARARRACSAPATSAGTRRGSRRAWRPRCSCSTEPRPAALGRPDPPGPHHDAGQQPPRGRAGGGRRRPRHRRGARARRARAGRRDRRDGARRCAPAR